MGGGSCAIPFNRSIHDTSTGTGADNPRQQPNVITSFIDASNVYGSDAVRAAALRTNDGSGRLRISGDDLLPMEGGMFLAGDVRANEQIGLTAMHTLFMREHNRLAALIALANPGLPGEQIYQRARKLVGAEMQKITYGEFLPALLGPGALTPYSGYDANVNATIMNVFATAAYRFGHSMLSPSLLLVDGDGGESPLPLRDAFFSPGLIQDGGDLEAILRGLYTQRPQEVDPFLVDDARNFLFGGGTFGMDLAALNIQRGRDHGLPPYNVVRDMMGLTQAGSFAEVSSDPLVQSRLAEAYASVDTIDAWVGGLAEPHVGNALVGELVRAVLVEQFEALRDGDRHWYQRPGVLAPSELAMVEATTLSVVISNNTNIDDAPADVFHVN